MGTLFYFILKECKKKKKMIRPTLKKKPRLPFCIHMWRTGQSGTLSWRAGGQFRVDRFLNVYKYILCKRRYCFLKRFEKIGLVRVPLALSKTELCITAAKSLSGICSSSTRIKHLAIENQEIAWRNLEEMFYEAQPFSHFNQEGQICKDERWGDCKSHSSRLQLPESLSQLAAFQTLKKKEWVL